MTIIPPGGLQSTIGAYRAFSFYEHYITASPTSRLLLGSDELLLLGGIGQEQIALRLVLYLVLRWNYRLASPSGISVGTSSLDTSRLASPTASSYNRPASFSSLRRAALTPSPQDPFWDSRKGLKRSRGMGRMMVEFCSVAISPIV